jgi:Spy/CpxP family protein refolding chaperone
MGMGMGPLSMLGLSDEQRGKIDKIGDDERKKHWEIMGKMLDEQSKLRDLYQADTPDPKKVGAAYGNIAKLRQQMVEAHVQARNQIEQVLTKEQREQLRQWRRGGWGPGAGMGPGMMRGMPRP